MVLIRKSDVPEYLIGGSLFDSFDDYDEELFEVPSEFMKSDLHIDSIHELRFALQSLRFWGVLDLPEDIYHYIFLRVSENMILTLESEFIEFESALRRIRSVKAPEDSNRIETHQQRIFNSTSRSGPIDAAICHGFSLQMIQWLHKKQHCRVSLVEVTRAASVDKHIKILEYFVEEAGCAMDASVTECAIIGGGLACLKYLLTKQCPLPNQSINIACRNGHSHILAFLLERGVPYYPSQAQAVRAAAISGHVACLKVLRDAGCLLALREKVVAVMIAVQAGHLDSLVYLHQNCGISFTDEWCYDMCTFAADGGQFSCLKYLQEAGCPLNPITIVCAFKIGSYECLRYAHRQGCRWPKYPWLVVSKNPKCMAYAMLYGGPFSVCMMTCCMSFGGVTLCYCVVGTVMIDIMGYSRPSLLFLVWPLMHTVLGWGVLVLYYYVRCFRFEK